ncbi:hypothetical protein RclHR1_00030026 [Rhizophagus clarus]|uniref:RNase H type-1 domain-containing protein n=1 Tax=Rhizophagus clarus TaxID=94130 RepID=A0A2Z6RJS8_9GLOM|nr:hypothetical protein RclHR1_00030026 [Rhizophagus clarus]
MGIRWIIATPELDTSIVKEFSCKATNFPSSTRAEALTLASALAVSPSSATVTIRTDSKCVIDTFNYVLTNSSPRRFLKINNFLIWKAITKIIKFPRLEERAEKSYCQFSTELTLFLKTNIWKSRNLLFKQWKLIAHVTTKLLKKHKRKSSQKSLKRKRQLHPPDNQLMRNSTNTNSTPDDTRDHVSKCRHLFDSLGATLKNL